MRRAQREETPVRTFEADYESECPCGEMILPGDKAGYIGDDTQASCWDCVTDVKRL